MSHSMDIEQSVRAYIIDTILLADDVTLESNTPFQEQGIIDSMGFLDLITFLGKEYNIEIKDEEAGIAACPIEPANLALLINLIEDGKITGKIGKDVFAEMYSTGKGAGEIVKAKGLEQVNDASEIEAAVDKVIASSAKQVEQYKSGKAAVMGYFVGQVMKETKGQANPKIVNELLKKKLG